MATIKKTAPLPPERTIGWFEREIHAHRFTDGLLDTANGSMLEIAEISGSLVGIWRRYRLKEEDLDVPALSEALGALLVAIGRTAATLDLSLEALMAHQVTRFQAPSAPAKDTRRKTGRPITTTRPPEPEAIPMAAPSPQSAARRRPRQFASPAVQEHPLTQDTSPGRTRRSKMPVSPTGSQGRQGLLPPSPVPTQVALFAEPAAQPPRKRTSKASR